MKNGTHSQQFKRSDAGLIPSDWKAVRLGRLSLEKPKYGLNAPSVDYSPNLPRYLRITDITGTGRYSKQKEVSVASVEASEFYLSDGDLVVARTGASVGKSYRYLPQDGPLVYAGFLIRLRPDTSMLLPDFLHAFMQTNLYWGWVQVMSTRSGQPGINGQEFSQLPVPVPPLSEQQKIVAILSTWDRAIDLTEKLIAAKQKRKQALMQQILTGKVRLPQFQSNDRNMATGIVRVPSAVRRGLYPPSVQPGIPKIIHRPKGWNETTMDKLLHIEKRPIELMDDKEYQLVVAKRNRGGIEPRETLLGHEVKTPTQFEVRAGDFVISKRQIIHGACGVVPAPLDGAVVSNEYSVCTVNASLNMEFLKYLSHTLYFQQTCFHASVGVALEKMIFRLEEWLKFPFLIPPIDEQQAIVSVLAAMDNELFLLSKRLRLLSQQKKGLMQQLLTGRIRVNTSTRESIHA